MALRDVEHRVENLERRMTTVEQTLPTLTTKADLLATKAEVRAEIKADGAETRRHLDVVAEGLRDDIRMIAESVVALQARVDAQHAEIKGVLVEHD